MRVLGIDPGKSGGFALADANGVAMCEVMPEHPEDIVALIHNWEPTHVYIEKVHAMPKQGVCSMFTFGQGFGTLIGIVKALRLPLRLVTPQEWAKVICKGSTGKDAKARSKEAALNLFPHINFLATPRSKKPHEGLLDACCIAEFGRREVK